MQKNPKQYWKLAKIPSFRTDFQRLSAHHQWIVGKTIDSMLMIKDPARVYEYTRCDECVPDLYLFGVADDGVGNKGVELQIYLHRSKSVLAPITVRAVR